MTCRCQTGTVGDKVLSKPMFLGSHGAQLHGDALALEVAGRVLRQLPAGQGTKLARAIEVWI